MDKLEVGKPLQCRDLNGFLLTQMKTMTCAESYQEQVSTFLKR